MFNLSIVDVILILMDRSFYIPTITEVNPESVTNDATSDELKDIGICYCDTKQNVCEYQCCCDLDCDSTQIKYWTNNFQCLSKSLSQRCVKDYWLAYINEKRGMKISKNAAKNETCILSDDQAVFSEYQTQKSEIPPETILSYYKNLSQTVGIVYPQKGDSIKTLLTPYKYFSMKGFDSGFQNSSFNIYHPDSFGLCGKLKSVKFLNEIPKTQCTIRYNIRQDCASEKALDIDHYFQKNLKLFTNFELKNTLSSNNIVIQYYLKDTNTDSIYSLQQVPASIRLSEGTTDCMCYNVISGLRYQIIYDETSFTVTGLSVHVFMRNSITNQCDQLGQTSYFTEVNFVNSKGSFYDGNPGYTQGQKVYGAQNTTSSGAQVLSFNSLGLIINNGYKQDGQCDTQTVDVNLLDPLLADYLRFGQGQSISCKQLMTKAQIQSNCNQAFLDSLTLFKNFPYTNYTIYFAKSSYANRIFLRDWIDIKALPHKNQISYNTSGCFMPTEYQLQVFYEKLGHVRKRQLYIVETYVGYTDYKTITLPATATDTDQATVTFTLNIEFVNLQEGDIENAMPKNPSFIPQLPDDFFFPVWYEAVGEILKLCGCLILFFSTN